MSRHVRVAVAGARGKLGSVAHAAFARAGEFEYAGGYAREADASARIYDMPEALLDQEPDVWFDALTLPDSFELTMRAVERGARPVIGTSGWSVEQRAALEQALRKKNIGGLLVPNFSLGAVLMMRFAEDAAKFFPAAEIVEMHRATKQDKPSGTAAATAERIAHATGSRPAIHSVRLPGMLAHQAVIFGGAGETLTIRHDSLSYESFVPGMLQAANAVMKVTGLSVGLDSVW